MLLPQPLRNENFGNLKCHFSKLRLRQAVSLTKKHDILKCFFTNILFHANSNAFSFILLKPKSH
jgi:hypothetical protein